MSKPIIHALRSVKKYGGTPEDYMPIHELMDSSKATIPDNRHRALTHNSWFISFILPKIFGETFKNSDGRIISTRDIGEDHVAEDYGMRFIPTAQDFLELIPMQDWMQNGISGAPRSTQGLKVLNKRNVKLD
jgi:hypothetical protein